jgi:hypothetical protein
MNGTPPRGKALPPRPSADLGYRGGGQGEYGVPQKAYRNDENAEPRSYGTPAQKGPRGRSQEPNGRVVLEGYRNDIMNGFEAPKPRYNPVSRADLCPEAGGSLGMVLMRCYR